MKHFIMQGLIPEAYEGAPTWPEMFQELDKERIRRWNAAETPLPREGEYIFLRHPRSAHCHFWCTTFMRHCSWSRPHPKEKRTHSLPFRSYLTIYLGFDLGDSPYEFLLELTARPALTATTRQIAYLYRKLGSDPINPDFLCALMN